MHQVTLEEAAAQLASLVQEAQDGGEVIITDNSRPVAKLIPLAGERPKPQSGSAKHLLIYMADDFDAPLQLFSPYYQLM